MADLNPLDEYDSLSGSPLSGIDDVPVADGAAAGAGSLQSELDKAKAQAEESHSLYLRALADFDNYKKRVDRMITERSDAGRRDLLKRMLEVIDSLDRGNAFGCNWNLNEHVLTVRFGAKLGSFFDRARCIVCQQWRHFQRDPTVDAPGRIPNRAEKIGCLSQILQSKVEEQLFTRRTLSRFLSDGFVVGVAVSDRKIEYRWIGRQARH
jgi:hypothetical protein